MKTTRLLVGLLFTAFMLCTAPAHASMFQGETLDTVANVMSWVVLVIVPVVGIAVFWLVHILPEKIAEKKQHPQAKAIQTLCLLSLFFGGLLWPLAWLWAYSKPVMYKMAYGTDKVAHGHEDAAAPGRRTRRGRDELEAAARARRRTRSQAGRQARRWRKERPDPWKSSCSASTRSSSG